MRILPLVIVSTVIIKDVLFFLFMEGQQTHSIGFNTKDGINLQTVWTVLEIFCMPPLHLSPSWYKRKLQAHSCFFSAAVIVIFKCILRSCIPQGRSFPRLAQSWSLCCCPFDLERKIPCLMYNFDFLLIKIAAWELITPPPIHPAEVQGYLWNISTPWRVKTEEKSLLMFTLFPQIY